MAVDLVTGPLSYQTGDTLVSYFDLPEEDPNGDGYPTVAVFPNVDTDIDSDEYAYQYDVDGKPNNGSYYVEDVDTGDIVGQVKELTPGYWRYSIGQSPYPRPGYQPTLSRAVDALLIYSMVGDGPDDE